MATLDEILVDQANRLTEAEGKVFALTHLLREMVPLILDPKTLDIRLATMIDAAQPDNVDDQYAVIFHRAVRDLFEQLVSSTPPAPPVSRSPLTLIKGGRND
jgi:hypothetical protein